MSHQRPTISNIQICSVNRGIRFSAFIGEYLEMHNNMMYSKLSHLYCTRTDISFDSSMLSMKAVTVIGYIHSYNKSLTLYAH